jgi:hypothetical protein
MLIVDSQVHIWGADTPDRPWPPGGAQRAQKPYPVTKDMLLAEMDTAGVSRVVIVPPSWEGDRNDLGLAAARLHPKRFAVMGRLAIERPESRALVAHWKKQPRRASRHRRAPPRAERCPFRDLHAHIRRPVDAFGPRRTFWGTDLTRMPCSYRACVNLFTQELPWLEGDDLEWVMGRGVCEWLGWP